MRVINAWVEEGYSLQYQLVNLLVSSYHEGGKSDEHRMCRPENSRAVMNSPDEATVLIRLIDHMSDIGC